LIGFDLKKSETIMILKISISF